MAWGLKVPSHRLNQSWLTVNLTIGDKLQQNHDWKAKCYHWGNAFENAVCKIAATLLSLHRVKPWPGSKGPQPIFQHSSCVFRSMHKLPMGFVWITFQKALHPRINTAILKDIKILAMVVWTWLYDYRFQVHTFISKVMPLVYSVGLHATNMYQNFKVSYIL